MITWMQRHRKYLVVTIWISTIAFIGAGFVGWGQYSYGDKAGAVAKVGDVSITSGELQKSYSNLFNQYNQLFQGKFDEKQAKEFGLQRQALRQLVNQALVLNLAHSYGLIVTDDELWNIIKSQPSFSKGGSFDKSTYEAVLKQNQLTIKEYEEAMKKELLIQKTLYMLASGSQSIEKNALSNALGVSDKISYKLLTLQSIPSNVSDEELKAFWNKHQNEFKTEPNYTIAYVRQSPLAITPSAQEINSYYESNRNQLKSAEGKLLSLTDAHPAIIRALTDAATEKEALRLYIDYKKGTLGSKAVPEKVTISASSSPFDPELTKEVIALNEQKPYLKPRKVGNDFLVIKLEKFNPARVKTFDEAKSEANALYAAEFKKNKLQELAQNSYKTFSGSVSDFLTLSDSSKLAGLSAADGSEFLSKLFTSKQKQGFVTLKSGNVILYNVLEQKLLQNKTIADEAAVAKLKGSLLDQGLLKTLESKYPVEIYVEGI